MILLFASLTTGLTVNLFPGVHQTTTYLTTYLPILTTSKSTPSESRVGSSTNPISKSASRIEPRKIFLNFRLRNKSWLTSKTLSHCDEPSSTFWAPIPDRITDAKNASTDSIILTSMTLTSPAGSTKTTTAFRKLLKF